MTPFEGSFLLLDRLARTLEGLSRKDDQFDDLVIGHDDTAYVGSPNLYEVADFYTGNPADDQEPGIIGLADFSGTGTLYAPQPFIVDVVGIGSSGAYSLPASTLAVAGDLEVVAIYGGFTGTIAACPAGYYDLGGNAQSTLCSTRLCYKVLTGPSTAISLSDLGETNGAVRFVIRGANYVGSYEVDAGLFSSYVTKTINDSTEPRVSLFFLLGYSLTAYADSLSSSYDIEPYTSLSFSGGYGLALHYSSYSGPYLGSSFTVTAHQSSYDMVSFCQLVLYNTAEAPTKDNVLVASESPDVAAIVLESVVAPLDVTIAASEAPDIAAFTVSVPKAAFASASFSALSSTSATQKKGGLLSADFASVSLLSTSQKKNAMGGFSAASTSSFVVSPRPGFLSTVSMLASSSVSESHIVLFGTDKTGSAVISLESSLFCSSRKEGANPFVENLSVLQSVDCLKGGLSIFSADLVISDSALGNKNAKVFTYSACIFYLNSDHTRSAQGSASIQDELSVFSSYSRGIGRSSSILCLSETAALCSKGARKQVSVIDTGQVSTPVLKSLFMSLNEEHASSVVANFSPAKESALFLDEEFGILTGHFKSLFGALEIDSFHFLNSTGRVVTVFEYGDIVIVDLRASLDSRNLNATRNNLALEVRRGVGADYERMADNPVMEVRRSLPEEFFGSATKLDGIEIVCVREIFDENK